MFASLGFVGFTDIPPLPGIWSRSCQWLVPVTRKSYKLPNDRTSPINMTQDSGEPSSRFFMLERPSISGDGMSWTFHRHEIGSPTWSSRQGLTISCTCFPIRYRQCRAWMPPRLVQPHKPPHPGMIGNKYKDATNYGRVNVVCGTQRTVPF